MVNSRWYDIFYQYSGDNKAEDNPDLAGGQMVDLHFWIITYTEPRAWMMNNSLETSSYIDQGVSDLYRQNRVTMIDMDL